ncbi:uncharacterized protein [Amphiura filiformis]|uniref:uncharacterized protein isoform X2 n=1 Tax=Amphiura filiformis TaxID=82378 RepID=UPI003B210013
MSPKPYQCGVCGKAFRTVQVLQKHTQTFHMRPQMGGSRSRGRGRGLYHGRPGAYRQLHTSQARFMCVMCNRSFRSPDLLQDHMTRSHMGQVTPVQLTQSQETFDPSSVQTSQAPATATLQSLQQQQQEQQLASSISFQSPDDPNAQLQMSQSDPSAFNVSTASTSGTFITPVPASMFQGLSAGASTSASQRSPNPSRNSHKWSLGQQQLTHPPLISDIKTAILNAAGPIATRRLLGRNGPRSILYCSQEQFDTAARELESANIGWIVTGLVPRCTVIFIKKPPDNVGAIAEALGLCSAHRYKRRFHMPLSNCISQNMRDKLIAMGYLTNEQALWKSGGGKGGGITLAPAQMLPQ